MVLIAVGVLLVVAAALALLAALSRARARPPDALTPGTLAPCPASPNCVTSLATDARHTIDPLRFEGGADAAWERLRAVLASLPHARPAGERPGYLHVEFKSPLFGFVDDVEFLLDAPNRRIEIRSASRVGWSDGGANRRRVEAIARLFARGT